MNSNRVRPGVPTGGQFASSARPETAVELTTNSLDDLFPDPDDATRATAFYFDWGYMDFDDYNGYTAYDYRTPHLLGMSSEDVRVGDEIRVPETSSVHREVVKVERTEAAGTISFWTREQDPQADEPLMSVDVGSSVRVLRRPAAPDLLNPRQFNKELCRRAYIEAANQASTADERHDVERLAAQAVEHILPSLIEEAIEQRRQAGINPHT